MKLTMRRVSLLEVETLRDFMEHTFRVAFEASNDPVFFQQYCEDAFSLEQIVGELAAPQSEFWFAFLEGELAAYLKLNFDQHPVALSSEQTVQVERLYILQKFQNQRLGTRLLQLAEERAQKVAAEWLWLSVWQENPPALRFYERNGFEVFGTEVFEVGDDPQIDWLVKKRVSV